MIRTKPGTLDHMREAASGSCTVQIRDADDPEAAAGALRRVLNDLYSIPHPDEPAESAPNFVSLDPDAGGGPAITFDMHDLQQLMPTVLRLLRRRLAEAGVHTALITWPDNDVGPSRKADRQRWSADVPGQGPGWFRVVRGRLHPQEGLRDQIPRQGTPRAAILRIYPMAPLGHAGIMPDVALPTSWLKFAADWMQQSSSASGRPWASLRDTNDLFRLSPGDSYDYLAGQMNRQPHSAHLVSGDIECTVRCCSCFGGQYPSLCLAAGGPASSDDELVDIAQGLIESARALRSEAGYAVVSLRMDFTTYWENPAYWGLHTRWPGAAYMLPLFSLTREGYIYDAFHYQLLGPAHVTRLSAGSAHRIRRLPNGMAELTVGSPESWLPGSFDLERVQREGRNILAPCIPSVAEVDRIYRSYYRD